MSPSSSPVSPTRMGVGGGGGDAGSNVVVLKRWAMMVVFASRVPRALVWLQENRDRSLSLSLSLSLSPSLARSFALALSCVWLQENRDHSVSIQKLYVYKVYM
jgi:hypothetical protein